MAYLNTKESKVLFQKLLNSKYYVDKSELISRVVSRINTEQCHLCITRPRRFGKSTNARMLACFLSRGLDAHNMFANLKVASNSDAMKHLGAHDVIYIDFSDMQSETNIYSEYINFIKAGIVEDLRAAFPKLNLPCGIEPNSALTKIFDKQGTTFTFIMDEWDSMFFNSKFNDNDKKDFLMFLKLLLKGRAYVEFAYMTGILPIAKHSSGSELNMFDEYSAVDDPTYNEFFGFTENEVKDLLQTYKSEQKEELCAKYKASKKQYSEAEFAEKLNATMQVDLKGLKHWYDGYFADDGSQRYNPRSVVYALSRNKLCSYWTGSGPYDEIYFYIKNNVASVRDDIAYMLDGQSVPMQPKNYAAASMTLNTRDEILSAMTVYGFLTYFNGYASIPNHELMLQFKDVVQKKEMGYVAKFALASKDILQATLERDSGKVAKLIEEAHDQELALLRYNNEAGLSALVCLMYLSARNYYEVVLEKHAGKGYADIAFVPVNRQDTRITPFIVELKVASENETAEHALDAAMKQIKDRNYSAVFYDALTRKNKFTKPPLAVGIAWDAKTKVHLCAIEEYM